MHLGLRQQQFLQFHTLFSTKMQLMCALHYFKLEFQKNQHDAHLKTFNLKDLLPQLKYKYIILIGKRHFLFTFLLLRCATE